MRRKMIRTRRGAAQSVSFFLSGPFSISGHKNFIIQALQQKERLKNTPEREKRGKYKMYRKSRF